MNKVSHKKRDDKMGKKRVPQEEVEKAPSGQDVCEVTLVGSAFTVFFGSMFERLRNEFVPSRVPLARWEASIWSWVAVGLFTFFSFLIISRYLYSFYVYRLKTTSKSSSGFLRFISSSGLRTVAVGVAPLGLFYVEIFILHLALPGAFLPENNYSWISIVYFTIWCFFYVLEW